MRAASFAFPGQPPAGDRSADAGVGDSAALPGLHGRRAARAAEHGHHAERRRSADAGDADHHGHRQRRSRVQPAPAVRPVAGERRDQCVGTAQLVPAGARREQPVRFPLGTRRLAAVVGGCHRTRTVHRDLQDPARGVLDRQRPDRSRRLLVPVAPDGQSARCRRPRRLRPDHRGAVDRRRQDRGRHLFPALPRMARAVQQHPARAHRQRRPRRIRCGHGPHHAGHRRPVPRRQHRPAARRDCVGPQRPILGPARQTGPDPLPPRRHPGHARRFDPQR